jgi:competence protein ComEC
MTRRLLLLLSALLLLASPARADGPRGLDIYFIDTEGGAATLIVTPAGESVLIDCGNPGTRDATRIADAAKKAGLTAIDHLFITHWHLDHYGGVGHLAKVLPIKHFYDRGIPEKLPEDPGNFPTLIRAYKAASGGKSTTMKPGDEIKLKQTPGTPPLSLSCLVANGEVIPERAGATPNPIAKENKPEAVDNSDNAKSLGFLLRYGGFRFLDLGDLTWNIEYKLVSPSDRIGPVDVYQVTHHGLDISNNPVLLRTVNPRVAIFNNGPRKGCAPEVTKNLRRLTDIRAIYQLHYNETVGPAENTDPVLIANPKGTAGELIHLSVAPDGKSYTITPGSKGKPRKYGTREG